MWVFIRTKVLITFFVFLGVWVCGRLYSAFSEQCDAEHMQSCVEEARFVLRGGGSSLTSDTQNKNRRLESSRLLCN